METTYAEKAAKRSGSLMSMHVAQLCDAQRKLTVTMRMRLIVEHAPWTTHRFDRISAIFVMKSVHILSVMQPVSRCLPQVLTHDLWCLNLHIACFATVRAPKVDQSIPDDHPLRMDKRHSRRLFFQRKEIQFRTDDLMISFFCLFQK